MQMDTDAQGSPHQHHMNDNDKAVVVDSPEVVDDDPNRMAFFPPQSVEERLKPSERMVAVPSGAQDTISATGEANKKADDAVVAALRGLPFSSTVKRSFHGLPMRIRWELWVQCMAWKTSDSSLPPLVAHIELGADGHYQSLRTPEGPAKHHSLLGAEAGLPREKFLVYHQRTDLLRLELRRALDDVCIGYSLFKLRDLSPLTPLCGWIKIKDPERRSPVDS